jgi:2-dehydro-3-deoxygluconokinase
MALRARILCFGELLLRLSAPDREHLFQQNHLDAHFGGAEANVAVALVRLGMPSAVVSAVPDDAVGDGALDAIRRHGVDVSGVLRAPGRLGLYYLTPGAGLRAASIVYDRAGSIFAETPSSAYDWPKLLDGVEWLHLSGITPALGPDSVRVGLDAIAAAHDMGVKVSFDGNFRASLWARWCSDPAPILAQYMAAADLLFGNHRDLSLVLGQDLGGDSPEARRTAALAAFDRFPRLSVIASTARTIHGPDHHRLSARIDTRADSHETGEIDVPQIVDRIGTGDAFAAGVLAHLPQGLAAAAGTGLALAALKHATPGDHSFTTARELAEFARGGLEVRR